MTLDKDWVLVPREPTERMLHWGDKAQYDTSDEFLGRDVYRAMLAAAPPPVITDAMVERGARGYVDGRFGVGAPIRAEDLAIARACLEAALRPGGGE